MIKRCTLLLHRSWFWVASKRKRYSELWCRLLAHVSTVCLKRSWATKNDLSYSSALTKRAKELVCISSSWEGTIRSFVTHCVNITHQVITMTMMMMIVLIMAMMLMFIMVVRMLMALKVITFLRRNVQNGAIFTHCVNITRRPWWRYARLSQLVAIVIVWKPTWWLAILLR